MIAIALYVHMMICVSGSQQIFGQKVKQMKSARHEYTLIF